MNCRRVFGRIKWIHLTLVPAFWAVHCTDDANDKQSSQPEASGGAGGGSVEGQAGESFGPIVICGNRTKLSECDPVSAQPCAEGTTCDHSAALGGFKCFENNQAAAGEFCDNETAFCGPGLYCETTTLMVCQHYCCESSDCVEGECYGGFYEDGEATIGFCFDEYGGLCAFAEEGAEPEECLGGAAGAAGAAGEAGIDTAGAGGSAP